MENQISLSREELMQSIPEIEYADELHCSGMYAYYVVNDGNGTPCLKRTDGNETTMLYAGREKRQQSGWHRSGSYTLKIISVSNGYVYFTEDAAKSNDWSSGNETNTYRVKYDGSAPAAMIRKKVYSEDPDGEYNKEWIYDEQGKQHEVTGD